MLMVPSSSAVMTVLLSPVQTSNVPTYLLTYFYFNQDLKIRILERGGDE